MVSKRLASGVAAFLSALVLASCGADDNSAFNVAAVDTIVEELFHTQSRASLPGQLVRSATTEGLVAFDAAGRIIPALADRWIVTDDGQSYIFRLREGNWGNGDPITAASAKKAIRDALDGLGATSMALDLSGVTEVRAMAGRVIELRLNKPMPYLLQLLAQPDMGLSHEGRGSGPMRAKAAGNVTVLSPIKPSELGLPHIENWETRSRDVKLHSLSGADAVSAFNEGKVDMVLGGRIQDFMLTRSVGILRGTIQMDPVIGLFGLRVMRDQGFLSETANREALSMAIDRTALMAPFGLGGWTPTTRIVPPSLEGDLGQTQERWEQQALEQRRQIAAGRVRQWKSKSGQNHATLQIWLPQGEGAQILLKSLKADFAAIGVTVKLTNKTDAADLILMDVLARYPRSTWFLNRLSCGAGEGLCSKAVDAKVAQAEVTPEATQRARMLAEAEAELTGENVFIPFGSPVRWSLVRGSVAGFNTNAWGWHPLMPLSWLPK